MYIGIDVGGTHTKFGLITTAGEVIEKAMIDTNHDKDQFIEDLIAIITNYQAEHTDILGVGISAPGIIKANGYLLTAGAIKPLYGTNLKEAIAKRVQLPVKVENDANAAAIAERWIGNAQGMENYLCMVLGTGIGGGIVANGQVYRGFNGMAGEFGWMLMDRLPATGDLETVSMNQRAAVVGGLCYQYQLALASAASELTPVNDAREIMERAAAGEQIAEKVLADFYRDLAVGLLNLISCFDPEAILIGGGISANEAFMNRLKQTLAELISRHHSLDYLQGIVENKILSAKLGNDAGMIGAVYQLHQTLI
ncbi:ROK family protein [Candidatus Enterococcus leclercqii]|uniref:ROK family protein n=1 Tax=Candidatus Enterococcus leclercqii TaxID=1857218 RepID=UPI001379E7FE|nr:ROK family protein [Enterococcus sp. CU9D]KAF1293892.1 sugar kinase [Enterococcus sp. CU9D]